MKTGKFNDEEVVAQGGGCCSPAPSEAKVSEAPCCDQPDDGSSCCDKSAPKEVNSEKTGCC